MRYALHARTILHTNIATDIRVAREAGYEGIELWIPKLRRFLDSGNTVADLKRLLGPLRVAMLDALLPIETQEADERQRLLEDCRRYAQIAEQLACPAIQVVALDGFGSDDWNQQRATLVESLASMTARTYPHGVRLAIEPVVFSRFHTLRQALQVIEELGSDRVGLCLDTFHLWTTKTPWTELVALDPAVILAVQLSDTQPKAGDQWRDEDRDILPGDGIVPMGDAIDAIAASGYNGLWSVELLGPRHWEWDPYELASVLKQRVAALADQDPWPTASD